MSRNRTQLSDRMISKLKASEKGQIDYFDALVPGLSVRVTKMGTKSFVVFYRVAGKQRRATLGRYGVITLAEARDQARDYKIMARKGIDPVEELNKERAANEAKALQNPTTFKYVSELFIERYAKKEQKSWKETERIFNVYVTPQWGDRDVTDIKMPDVVTLLDRVEDNNGPIMANRTLAAIRKCFNWCMVDRGILEANPIVPGMSRANEKKRARQRWLRNDEIKELWAACDKIGWPFGPIFKMLLVTGQRRGEVAQMRWRDIDFENKLWTIPKEFTKNGMEHQVPLSSIATGILEKLPRLSDKKGKPFQYVFCSGRQGDRPLSGFSRAGKGIRKYFAPEEEHTLHDLRRTCHTHMSELGVDRYIAEKVLNHADGSINAVYDRHSYLEEKRNALELWSNKIEGLVNGNDDKTVEQGSDK